MTSDPAHAHFVKRLASFGSRAAANSFLDLVEDLLDALDIEPSDPRIALTVPQQRGRLPVNIGSRYVLTWRGGSRVSVIVAEEAWKQLAPERPDWPIVWRFEPASREKPEVLPVMITLPGVLELRNDSDLWAAWLDAARREVARGRRSSRRYAHDDGYARAIRDAGFRADLLNRAFPGEARTALAKRQRVSSPADVAFIEGRARTVRQRRVERNRHARAVCLAHYGAACVVCGLDFGAVYGAFATRCIHVHHLTPLATRAGAHRVDPVADLRPVCPNCHAVLHRRTPPLTPEEGRALLRA